jgi:predicted Zn-ribbon and HTH transcriptional regulator
MRFYGLRTILNTWVYCLTGRRLPGWMGDTLYQSQRRLAKYYSKVGLRVLAEPAAKKFCGFPVFIYQHLQKV